MTKAPKSRPSLSSLFKRGRKARTEETGHYGDTTDDTEALADELGEPDGLVEGHPGPQPATASKMKGMLSALTKDRSKKADDKGTSAAETVAVVLEKDSVIPSSNEKRVNFDGQKTLLVGSRKYALGGIWLSTGGEKLTELAQSSAGDSDLVVDMRKSGQAGFFNRDEGVRSGSSPGVVSLKPEHVGQNWLVAVKVDTLAWWVGAQRDGLVYEDQITRNDSEAHTLLFDILQAGEWDRIICPADWGVEHSIEAEAKDIFVQTSKARVRALRPIKDNLKRIIVLTVLTGIIGGGGLWYNSVLKEQAAEEARMRQLEAQRIRLIPTQFPWAKTTDLADFTSRCVSEIDRTLPVPPGWDTMRYTCQEVQGAQLGRYQIETRFDGSSMARHTHLQVAVEENNLDHPTQPAGVLTFSPDLKVGNYVRPVDMEDVAQTDISLISGGMAAADIENLIRRRAQTLGVNATLTPVLERVTPAQMQRRTTPIFNRHLVVINAAVGIEEIAEIFGDLPAIRPVSLSYNTKTMGWSLVFSLYHTPITR